MYMLQRLIIPKAVFFFGNILEFHIISVIENYLGKLHLGCFANYYVKGCNLQNMEDITGSSKDFDALNFGNL